MALLKSWTPTAPANSDNPQNGALEIRDFKAMVGERARHGGHEWETGTGLTATAGRHKCFDAGDGDVLDATLLAGEFYIFDSVGTTKLLTISDATAASPSRFVINSTLAVSMGVGTSTTQKTLAIGLPGGATGVQAGAYFENRGTAPMTILGIKLVAGTAPVATDLTVNVFRLASGYANPGAGGTTMLTTPASDLEILVGARVGAETTAIVGAQSVLSQGDAIYFDITTLSAAVDIVVYIRYRS